MTGIRASTVARWGLGALLAVQALRLEAVLARSDNAHQRAVLSRLAQLTGPEDVAYDNSGGYVSRPHAHFYFIYGRVPAQRHPGHAGSRGSGGPGGSLAGSFLSVREDRYFVEPAGVLETGSLFIDGARVREPVFTLARGAHSVRYEGPVGSFYLLWLPRDGSRWVPWPGLPARYSRLF